MKKIISTFALMLAVSLCIGTVGCGKDTADEPSIPETPTNPNPGNNDNDPGDEPEEPSNTYTPPSPTGTPSAFDGLSEIEGYSTGGHTSIMFSASRTDQNDRITYYENNGNPTYYIYGLNEITKICGSSYDYETGKWSDNRYKYILKNGLITSMESYLTTNGESWVHYDVYDYEYNSSGELLSSVQSYCDRVLNSKSESIKYTYAYKNGLLQEWTRDYLDPDIKPFKYKYLYDDFDVAFLPMDCYSLFIEGYADAKVDIFLAAEGYFGPYFKNLYNKSRAIDRKEIYEKEDGAWSLTDVNYYDYTLDSKKRPAVIEKDVYHKYNGELTYEMTRELNFTWK